MIIFTSGKDSVFHERELRRGVWENYFFVSITAIAIIGSVKEDMPWLLWVLVPIAIICGYITYIELLRLSDFKKLKKFINKPINECDIRYLRDYELKQEKGEPIDKSALGLVSARKMIMTIDGEPVRDRSIIRAIKSHGKFYG